MKTQEIVKGFTGDSRAHLINQLIISHMDDIENIKKKILKYEEELFTEVYNIFRRDPKFVTLVQYFNLTVYDNKSQPEYSDYLIDAICKLISKSPVRLYGVPDDRDSALINYGGRIFSIPFSELKEKLENEPSENIFQEFNAIMSKYNVYVHEFNNYESETDYIRIHIRILP